VSELIFDERGIADSMDPCFTERPSEMVVYHPSIPVDRSMRLECTLPEELVRGEEGIMIALQMTSMFDDTRL
jgi:hypothetical protein